MYILGINAFHADASAALFRDGQLLAASEEERFRRVKHWAGFPSEAILFCLQEAGITLDDVAHIAIGRDPLAKWNKKLLYLLQHPASGWKTVADRISNSRQVSDLSKQLDSLPHNGSKHALKRKIHYIEHHRSHLASAFFASPFEEAALLSIDGSGDFSTTMTGVGRGNQLEVLESVDFPHSAGFFYTAFTQFLGFPYYGDEYKIMGLAPYGKPVYTDALRKVIHFKENGLFSLDLKYFRSASQGIITYSKDFIPQVAELYSGAVIEQFGPPRKATEPLTAYHKDLAASVQAITEELIFHLLHHLHKVTGLKKLCLAGGVAQNSVANGKIVQRTPFEKVYIPSAGHDAGISMGAALYVYNQQLQQPRAAALRSAYTGKHFSNEEIEQYLQSRNIRYERWPDE
ncbi:MAG: carbamoyltransferase, partial [Chitinophagaceae bacterium]